MVKSPPRIPRLMANPEPGGPDKEKGRPWTPGEMESFMKELGVIADRLADKYIAFEREKWLHEVAMENAVSKADWKVLAILMVFLAVVVTIVSVFLIGTVAGYIFALVQRHLFPETVEVAPPE